MAVVETESQDGGHDLLEDEVVECSSFTRLEQIETERGALLNTRSIVPLPRENPNLM